MMLWISLDGRLTGADVGGDVGFEGALMFVVEGAMTCQPDERPCGHIDR